MAITTNRLAEILAERGMSLSDLQRATGMSYTALFDLYHQRTTMIRMETLTRLCEALGIRPGDLLVYVAD